MKLAQRQYNRFWNISNQKFYVYNLVRLSSITESVVYSNFQQFGHSLMHRFTTNYMYSYNCCKINSHSVNVFRLFIQIMEVTSIFILIMH